MDLIGRFAPSTTGEAHPGTLLAALLAWLDARAANGRIVLRLENLDHTRCKPEWAAHDTRGCKRGEIGIDLTHKEFSILEYLARRRGEVISKTELLEHAWDFAHDGDANTVEVHLSSVYRKLEISSRAQLPAALTA